MPKKRRLAKGRDQLSPGQAAFLANEDLPAGAGFADSMQLVWLRQSWRDNGSEAMPDASPSAREIWAEYGAEIVADWPLDAPPHPALRRFGLP
jgi:hypothetical protein